MSEFFDDILEWCPVFLVYVLWVLVLPVRIICLLLLPLGSARENHKLFKIRHFFEFDA